jgi:hypothetical protein
VNFFRGVISYPRDIAVSLGYVIDSSGLAGAEAQNRATLVGQLADRAFGYIRNHPLDVLNRVGRLVLNNRAQVAGRLGTGALYTGLGGPVFGGAMTALSGFGGAIRALDGVVSQLEAGNISTRSLSDQTVSTIAAFGVLGGSVNFNARTGDLTARITTNVTGSRLTQTRTSVICNVNSKRGC